MRDKDLIKTGLGGDTLTYDGWDKVNQLRRKTTQGSMAFMAMQFDNIELTKIFEDHFKKAVRAAGFNLKRLDDEPKAGPIDERLRVEIRRSVFMVSDLTDNNLGAYWEAGFAEGLGKPVIYTCQKRFFETVKTHFDTNHLHTVLWDESEPSKAAEELKATIRNTLPLLAKMDDE